MANGHLCSQVSRLLRIETQQAASDADRFETHNRIMDHMETFSAELTNFASELEKMRVHSNRLVTEFKKLREDVKKLNKKHKQARKGIK